MQAISVKILFPTNKSVCRVKAAAAVGSIIVPYDYSKDLGANVEGAAYALANKHGWLFSLYTDICWKLAGGQLPNDTFAFVLISNGQSTF